MTEETVEEADQIVNSKRNFSKNPTMAEETAEEAAQIVNSKRNFSINPTMAEEAAEESAQMITAKRLAAKERKTAQLDDNPPGQRESKRIKTENDSDDDWVWDFVKSQTQSSNPFYHEVKKKQRFGDMYLRLKKPKPILP